MRLLQKKGDVAVIPIEDVNKAHLPIFHDPLANGLASAGLLLPGKASAQDLRGIRQPDRASATERVIEDLARLAARRGRPLKRVRMAGKSKLNGQTT